MAFVVPRKGKKGIYVYYHDRATGKQQQVPRKKTKHLDKASQQEIQEWLDQWDKQHGRAAERSERINLKDDERLMQLWNQYKTQHTASSKRRIQAENSEQRLFDNHILPFFVGQLQNKTPESWHDQIPNFHAYLFSKKLGDQTNRYVLWALRRFGEHLVWARHMNYPFAVKVPARQNPNTTPLEITLTPDQILNSIESSFGVSAKKWLKIGGRPHEISEDDIKLSVLIGYFGSLRPQEQWALEKSDFITGDVAEKHTKTLPGLRSYGLGTKLSIVISKSWQKTNPPKIEALTKSHYSAGVVNIWNPKAAKLIAELVKKKPAGRVFKMSYFGWFQLWRRTIYPKIGVSAHDLRRASGQYLGKVKRIDLMTLKEHMRHSEIETTILYTRDPAVPLLKANEKHQDFDDI